MTKSADRRTRHWIPIIVLMLGVFLNGLPAAADDSLVFSPRSSPFGLSFPEWTAQWWQYVLSFPATGNPGFDQMGEQCITGQRGPVWFLVGSFGGSTTRRCSVPEGKALLVPILNVVDVNTAHQSAAELRAEIRPCIDGASDLSIEVDGEAIRRLRSRFRVRSMVFEVALPKDNVLGLEPGIYSPAVDEGFYVMLQPLSKGKHTVHFAATTTPCGFSLDVTYHLTIVAVNLDEK